MESIEKLREFVGKELYENERIGHGDYSHLHVLIEDVKREIAERYMKVPVDADGVPIRIGDELCLSKLTRGEVSALMLTPDGWEWELEGDDWYDIRFTNHVKPDPVKELLIEFAREYVEARGFANESYENMRKCGIADEYAERIREAVGA